MAICQAQHLLYRYGKMPLSYYETYRGNSVVTTSRFRDSLRRIARVLCSTASIFGPKAETAASRNGCCIGEHHGRQMLSRVLVPGHGLTSVWAVGPGRILMKQLLQRIWSDESGQGMVEYALIVGLVAVGLIAVFLFLRNSTGNVLNTAADSLKNTPSSPYKTS